MATAKAVCGFAEVAAEEAASVGVPSLNPGEDRLFVAQLGREFFDVSGDQRLIDGKFTRDRVEFQETPPDFTFWENGIDRRECSGGYAVLGNSYGAGLSFVECNSHNIREG